MNERHKVILGTVIVLGTIAYGAWQWNVGNVLKAEAYTLQGTLTSLTTESSGLATEYQSIKKTANAERESSAQELAQVFPTEENLSDLTRLLDQFALKNNFEGNPFFISSVNYQAVVAPDGALYRYVPLTLNITTSKKNLSKFLEYIESSGSLEGGVRLMSVEGINVQYPRQYGDTYSIQMDLNAYFAQSL